MLSPHELATIRKEIEDGGEAEFGAHGAEIMDLLLWHIDALERR